MNEMNGDGRDRIYGRDNECDGAHGWIQWKGTDACIDLHCTCGHHGHYDGGFLYFYECPICAKRYALGQVVKLILLDDDEAEWAGDFKTDTCGDD